MERAIRFYEDFFDQPVTERDDIYSVFDIDGFRYGLFAFQMMNEIHSFGNNCLPSISFENVKDVQLGECHIGKPAGTPTQVSAKDKIF